MSERRFRFVQHISGQGKTWPLQEVSLNNPAALPMWFVYDPESDGQPFTLPKSEYRLVEPPERWVDVTEQCSMYFHSNDSLLCHLGTRVCERNGYRLRKVQVRHAEPHDYPDTRPAFIVEKKEPADALSEAVHDVRTMLKRPSAKNQTETGIL